MHMNEEMTPEEFLLDDPEEEVEEAETESDTEEEADEEEV